MKNADAPLPMKKQTCGARTRGGTPCRRPPLRGRTRCRLHGGKSPIKHGLRAQLLGERPGLRRFLEAISETEQTEGNSLAGEIRTVRARLLEVQVTGPDPTAEAALVTALARLCGTEKLLGELVPRQEAIQALNEVLAVTRSVVTQEEWGKIEARLYRLGYGGIVEGPAA